MPQLIMTHHAIERQWQRRITRAMIEQTITQPDGQKAESDGDTQFNRTLNGRKVHVVAHPQGRDQWLIKTVWVDGEGDPHPLWKFAVVTAYKLWRTMRR
ncbi:MAG: DUF4258 domain-containing protein [Anaerolineae bacterium]